MHPEFRSGLAAPRLVNTFMNGEHDLALTDSANNISKNILQRMGYTVIPALNIHWRRPLRPTHYAIYGLSVATESLALSTLRVVAKPLCSIADRIAAKMTSSPFRHTKPRLEGSELDIETHLRCMADFRKGYSLWPQYNVSSLQWLLGYMESRPARGALRKVLLRDDAKKIVGWYIYYVKPGAIGEVAQIGGDDKLTKEDSRPFVLGRLRARSNRPPRCSR